MRTLLNFIQKNLFLIILLFFITTYSQSVAKYNITFTSVWNSTDHGTLPGSAHWSNLIGSNHSTPNELFEMGTMASQGVEDVAETGSNTAFRSEINTSITATNSEQLIEMSSVGTATGAVTIMDVEISEQYPLLSLISMIAPSPDWIIGINSYDLRQGGDWIASASIDLFPYDAGTEEGTGYSISNSPTDPQENITSLVNIAPFNDQRIGYFTITLLSVLGIEDEILNDKIKIYPNPSNGLISFSNTLGNPINKFEVYDLLGKQVFNELLNENEINKTFDVSQLKSGIYLVKLSSDDGKTSVLKKIILN